MNDDNGITDFERKVLDALGVTEVRPEGERDEESETSMELQAIQAQSEFQEVVIELVNGYRQRLAAVGHYDGAMAENMLLQYHAHLLRLMGD